MELYINLKNYSKSFKYQFIIFNPNATTKVVKILKNFFFKHISTKEKYVSCRLYNNCFINDQLNKI